MGFLIRVISAICMFGIVAVALHFQQFGMHILWTVCQASIAIELTNAFRHASNFNRILYILTIASVYVFTTTYVYEVQYQAVIRLSMILFALVNVNILLFQAGEIDDKGAIDFKHSCIGISSLGVTIILVCVCSQFVHVLINEEPGLLLLQFLMVIVNDSFAYFCGVLLHNKIFKRGLIRVSPSKSIEGFIGGGAFNIGLVPVMVKLIQRFYPIDAPIWLLYGFAIYVAFLGPIGGFYGSLLKRSVGIKDFGKTIPGHGGVMDRCDCQLISAMVLWLFVQAAKEINK